MEKYINMIKWRLINGTMSLLQRLKEAILCSEEKQRHIQEVTKNKQFQDS